MSNPFQNSGPYPDPNPYQSPPPTGDFGGPGQPHAAERLNVPGLALIVISGIWVALLLVSLVANVVFGGLGATMADDSGEAASALIGMVSGVIGNVIGLALQGVVIFGAIKMRKLENYGLAMASAIIACIPCCGSPCYILGIPFGIWALVVLLDPQVSSAFRR